MFGGMTSMLARANKFHSFPKLVAVSSAGWRLPSCGGSRVRFSNAHLYGRPPSAYFTAVSELKAVYEDKIFAVKAEMKGVQKKIDALENQIDQINEDITLINKDLRELKAEIKGVSPSYLSPVEKLGEDKVLLMNNLLKKEASLLKKEASLREEKATLLKKEASLLNKEMAIDYEFQVQKEREIIISHDEIEKFILQLCEYFGLDREKCFDVEYSSKNHRHFVREYLPYRRRTFEENKVVRCMMKRQTLRKQDYTSTDKMNNALIAIPGSPGIGKSSFLAHLPESEIFQNYSSSSRVIVSPFTFTNGMSEFYSSLSLRIIFGAIQGMSGSDIQCTNATWANFHAIFQVWHELSCSNAVRIITEMYCRDPAQHRHRVLLLTDELSKSGLSAIPHMTAIGTVLDLNENVDVVVSALSPQFVKNLLSGSQRSIDYNVLPPLVNEQLGYDTIRALTKHIKFRDPFSKRVLDNMGLLASGHPRTIQKLIEALRSDINSLEKDVADGSLTPSMLVVKLCDFFNAKKLSENLGGSQSCFERYALRTLPMDAINDDDFRMNLENGQIMVMPKMEKVVPLMSFPAFMNILKTLPHSKEALNNPRTHAAIVLLKDFLLSGPEAKTISTWFERAVLLTIATRLFETIYSFADFDFVFGTVSLKMKIYPSLLKSLNLTMATEARQVFDIRSSDDKSVHMIVPPDNFPGIDGIVDVQNQRFYLQMKIAETIRGKSAAYIVANAIQTTLRTMPRSASYEDTHFVFFMWYNAPIKNGGVIGMDEVLLEFDQLPKFDATLSGSRDIGLTVSEEEARDYVERFFDTNVKIMFRTEMDQWILPTLRVVPRLVEAVLSEYEEKEEKLAKEEKW